MDVVTEDVGVNVVAVVRMIIVGVNVSVSVVGAVLVNADIVTVDINNTLSLPLMR